MSFKVGENIGPYRILEQLGQGGMATVFKAYHPALDRYVALKVLHPAFNQDQTFTARFQREARVVARLEHPNIVPIYDYSEHESRPYLVMKFIEGDTLKARLNRGPLSSEEIEKVVNSVGSALAYAHHQGILHRDIKPSNVLIAGDGVMYLADFGLARIAQAGESTISSDSIMGTPQYISPEQAMGKKDLDEGTDLYSFGVMLYEMVVGQVPFSADTPFSIIHDHIYSPLPLPMDINPKVPEPVQRVLLKALAKDRGDRYASVEEMVKAFKDAWAEAGIPMQGTGITMRPGAIKPPPVPVAIPRTVEPAARTVAAKAPAKKRSTWTWVAVGLVTCLCLGFVLAVLRNNSVTSTSLTSTAQAATPVQVDTPKPPIPEGSPPPGLPQNIDNLRELVAQNPGDPYAHLQLSLAYWDAGEKRSSLESLAQAANLAGPNNREFFTTAVKEYQNRGAWLAAAGMNLRLIQTYSGRDLPEEVEYNFHESVYKAAEDKAMPKFVFFERVDSADLPMGFIARGRYALFNGSLEDAKTHLGNAERLKPELFEVFLLKAEIYLKEGKTKDARPILISLSSDMGAPMWIRVMAEELLKKAP